MRINDLAFVLMNYAGRCDAEMVKDDDATEKVRLGGWNMKSGEIMVMVLSPRPKRMQSH
jgi:hypothetical protein